tara:strand:+ start:461 stop:628 length:168 start_codon:yes stop_codon:yes gene_type:complete
MKAGELTDVTITESGASIVVELPNGNKISTTGFYYDTNGRGEPIIVIKCKSKARY